jgi:hypothetical protein
MQEQLSLEVALQPRFSILPTKTEYAKWSLYSQLLPRDSSWVPDAGKGFTKLGIGERYTDNQKAELLRDLRTGKHKLYCWDTPLLMSYSTRQETGSIFIKLNAQQL